METNNNNNNIDILTFMRNENERLYAENQRLKGQRKILKKMLSIVKATKTRFIQRKNKCVIL